MSGRYIIVPRINRSLSSDETFEIAIPEGTITDVSVGQKVRSNQKLGSKEVSERLFNFNITREVEVNVLNGEYVRKGDRIGLEKKRVGKKKITAPVSGVVHFDERTLWIDGKTESIDLVSGITGAVKKVTKNVIIFEGAFVGLVPSLYQVNEEVTGVIDQDIKLVNSDKEIRIEDDFKGIKVLVIGRVETRSFEIIREKLRESGVGLVVINSLYLSEDELDLVLSRLKGKRVFFRKGLIYSTHIPSSKGKKQFRELEENDRVKIIRDGTVTEGKIVEFRKSDIIVSVADRNRREKYINLVV